MFKSHTLILPYSHAVIPSLHQVWLLLFSDILLLTQRQGKLLTCLESAIPLACLTAEDFNCSEGVEGREARRVVLLIPHLTLLTA